MKRNWPEIIGGYVLIALLGIMAVLVVTAYARASIVQRSLTRAEHLAIRGKPGTALGHLDRVHKWSRMYPELERHRLLAIIRCHVQRMDVRRAIEAADAVLEVDVYDIGGSLLSVADSMPAELVNMTILKTTAAPQAAWDGYVCLIQELRRYGREDLLSPIAATLSERFPGGALPPAVHAALRAAGRAANLKAIPARPPQVASTPAGVSDPSATTVTPATPAATTHVAQPVSPPATVSTPEPPPSAQGTPTWAIALRDGAPAYDLRGQLRERLDIGSVIEISDVRDSSAGRVAVGRLSGTSGPSIAVYLKDLETYDVPLAEVPPGTRNLLVRRIQLQSTTQGLRRELTAAAIAAANPYATEFGQAKSAYAAFFKRANDAKQKMEASTGAEHMKYADELRAMKHEEVAVRRAFDAAKKAYDAWMAANEKAVAPADSPELNQLEAELAQVEAQLEQL